LPATGDACQPAGRAGGAETFERLEILGADECRDRLAVAGDYDRLAALDLADLFRQRGLHLGHRELLPGHHTAPPKTSHYDYNGPMAACQGACPHRGVARCRGLGRAATARTSRYPPSGIVQPRRGRPAAGRLLLAPGRAAAMV